MKKLLSLFAVVLFSLGAMATDYNKTPLTLDAGETNGQEMKLTIYRSGDLETTVIATSTTSEFLQDPERNLYECFFQNWGGGSADPIRSTATVTNENGVSTLKFTYTWTTYPTAPAQLRFVPRRDNSAGGSDIFGGTATNINMDFRIARDYVITAYVPAGNAAPYIHFWGEDFDPGTWPQMDATAYANTYTYTVTNAPVSGIQVLFSHSEKNTADQALITEDAFYNVYWNGNVYTAAPTTAHNMVERTIKVNANQTPKIHYWGVANAPEWDDDPDMTLVPGYTDWYEYTVSNVDENNGVNYIIRLGGEQSANQSTLVNVCLSTSIDNNATKKVILADTDCPAQAVPDAPHASGKGFGTYQATGIALYDWEGNFAGTTPCGSISLYVVTVGNNIYYKAIAEDGGTFENGTDYFCQLRTWKNDNTEMREHWAREMSNDKTARWTAFGGANNPDLAPYGEELHLTSYMVMSGCGARTMQTITYNRDFINNPIIDVIAPVLSSASVTRNISTYTISASASADDEIFYLFKDITADKVYVSLTNSIDIQTDGTGVAHTFECYAVDYNGNMSAKQEVSVAMESIQVPAAPAPAKEAADVLSIYSDDYTSVVDGGSRCAWNGAVSVQEIETGTNQHAYLYNLTNNEGSNWFGWDYAVKDGYKAEGTTGIDASAMKALHVDIWSATNGAISVYPIYGGGVATKDAAFYRFDLTADQWTSVDITPEMLQNVPAEGYDWSSIFQLKFAGCTATGVIAIDNVYFWKEAAESYKLAANGSNWASLALPFDAVVPEGCVVYYASAKAENVITLSPLAAGAVLPKEEGVIVKKASTADPYTFAAAEEEATALTNNLFENTAKATASVAASSVYVLNASTSSAEAPVFSTFTGTTIPVNKAYLPIEKVGISPRFIIEGTEEVTAVENVEAANAVKFIENGVLYIQKNGRVYNAMGQIVK